ncbi:hypothetical protein BH11PSE3_BH11PSE3_18390 [soil metagenome]
MSPVASQSLVYLTALIALALPVTASAQQFGGARRVEVAMTYPFTAVGKWTFGDGGTRSTCTAFLVNNCTLVTASRCGQGRAGTFQFEASDGQRYQVRNVRADLAKIRAAADARTAAAADKGAAEQGAVEKGAAEKPAGKSEELDLDVAFGKIAARPGQPLPGEKYGRFAIDEADTVAAASGFTAHCSYGFSTNEEGKGGRGTLDPDVYVWGSLRRWFPKRARTDEYFLHMGNGAYGASGSPIFRCLPIFNDGKLLGVDVSAPTRLVGVFIRLNNERDGLKFADRLRVEPKDMAWGIGSQQFHPYLLDYVKDRPCEALR